MVNAAIAEFGLISSEPKAPISSQAAVTLHQYPTLSALIKLFPEGRLNGYNLSTIVEGMSDPIRRKFEPRNYVGGQSYSPDELTSRIIVYHLLESVGHESSMAAHAAWMLPEPEIFHPIRSRGQAHSLAKMLCGRSVETSPIEALLYVADSAKSVVRGVAEYTSGLEKARAGSKYLPFTGPLPSPTRYI